MEQATLQRRISKIEKTGRLSKRDAAALIDMSNAGRNEVARIVDFADRYLPAPVALPRKRVVGLIADAARISATRARIKSDPVCAEIWKSLEESNQAAMDPKSSAYIDWRERENRKLWDRRHSHWVLSRTMQDLAWGGAISGDAKLTKYAANILVTIARHRQGWGPMHCNYGRPYMGWLNDNLLDVGHITLGLAVTYDLVRGVLGLADRAEIANYFEPYFHKALTYRFSSLNSPGNNFAPIGFGGAGLMALALFDEYPNERKQVLADLLAWSQAYATFALDYIAGSDGAAVEGSGYCSASMTYAMLFAQGLNRALGRDLFKHPTLDRFARYLAIETLPGGGAFNNYNDNHYETNVALWPMIARGSGHPIGDWIWRTHEGPDARILAPQKRDRSYSDRPYVLLFREPANDRVSPEMLKLPRIHHFSQLDHLTMRTGWDRNDLHVTFQCTKPRPHVHVQADRLNYTVYALGERFVVDSGYGMVPIPGSTEVNRMGGLAESHNQVLIDGVGQSHRADIPAGSIERWERNGEWVWAIGEATGSYPAAKCVKRFLAVRLTAENPVVVQADWIVPADGKVHRYECLLQSGEGNKLKVGSKHAVITGAQGGAVMNVAYQSGSPVKTRADEWLNHPRLHFVSKSVEHWGVLVMCGGQIRRTSERIAWMDALGPGIAHVTRSAGGMKVDLGLFSVKM